MGESHVALDWAPNVAIAIDQGKPTAGVLTFHGGTAGVIYGEITIQGQLDPEWVSDFVTD